MEMIRSLRGIALVTGIGFGAAFVSGGCGSGNSGDGQVASQISPEMQKKVDENLKDYSKRAAERGKAGRYKRN